MDKHHGPMTCQSSKTNLKPEAEIKERTTDKNEAKDTKECATTIKRKVDEDADQVLQPESEKKKKHQKEQDEEEKAKDQSEEVKQQNLSHFSSLDQETMDAKSKKNSMWGLHYRRRKKLGISSQPRLKIDDLEMGRQDAKVACSKKLVGIYYTVKLLNSEEILYATPVGEPYIFLLGYGGVIEGLEKGVDGMRIGGRRRLTFPPSMGYGALGLGKKISPGSVIVMEVELVEVLC